MTRQRAQTLVSTTIVCVCAHACVFHIVPTRWNCIGNQSHYSRKTINWLFYIADTGYRCHGDTRKPGTSSDVIGLVIPDWPIIPYTVRVLHIVIQCRWHRPGSTLAQVMACCLTAPRHYLNQCWLRWGFSMFISQRVFKLPFCTVGLKIVIKIT